MHPGGACTPVGGGQGGRPPGNCVAPTAVGYGPKCARRATSVTVAHCLQAGAGAGESGGLAPGSRTGPAGLGRGARRSALAVSPRCPSVPAASQLIGSQNSAVLFSFTAQRTVRVQAGRIAHLGRSDVDIDLGDALGCCASDQWEGLAYLLLIGRISLALAIDPCSSYPALLGFHACASPPLCPAGPASPRDRPRTARPCSVLTPHTVATLAVSN